MESNLIKLAEKYSLSNSFENVKQSFKKGLITKELFLSSTSNFFEKAVYADNPENKRLKRVGKQYGSNGEKDEAGDKKTSKKEWFFSRIKTKS